MLVLPQNRTFFCDFLLFFHIGPKLLLDNWGRPLKVLEAKITICNFFVETKNKKSIFHVDLTSKLNPVFYFLLFLSYRPKLLVEYWGRPMKVFEAKILICNFFVGTKNKKPIFHVDLTSKLNPVFYFLLFLSYRPKLLVEYWGRPMKVFGAKKNNMQLLRGNEE